MKIEIYVESKQGKCIHVYSSIAHVCGYVAVLVQ